MNLEAKIEAILFWKAEPITISKIAKILNEPEAKIFASLDCLSRSLESRGLTVVRKNDEVALGTAPEASSIIEQLTREELSRDLGKAGLETLTIILYRAPVARAEIDYIRGVNSNFILRALQIRGLVEKINNPEDGRSFLYQPTIELLQHLGISRIEELPDYQTTTEKLKELIS